MLYNPNGIFVDNNFNLYVADTGNHRIQFFQSGQLTATTVVGKGAPGTISLYNPTDVLLDADGYLFIVDSGNYRIVGSASNGFRCIFIFLVVFVCMSMFLTIINESFRTVRNNAKIKSNEDQHILSFIWNKFQQWIGFGRANDLERDEQMRSKYLDPIEHFPERIDQLLDALNRVRFNYSNINIIFCV